MGSRRRDKTLGRELWLVPNLRVRRTNSLPGLPTTKFPNLQKKLQKAKIQPKQVKKK